jgi:hypothetical protein
MTRFFSFLHYVLISEEMGFFFWQHNWDVQKHWRSACGYPWQIMFTCFAKLMKCVTMPAVKLDIWPSLACILCMDFYNFLHAEMTRNVKCSRLCIVCGAAVQVVCMQWRTDRCDNLCVQSARLTTPDTTYKQNTLCCRITTSPNMNTHILIKWF